MTARITLIGGAFILGAIGLGVAWYLGGDAREDKLKVEGLEGRIDAIKESQKDQADVENLSDAERNRELDRLLGGRPD